MAYLCKKEKKICDGCGNCEQKTEACPNCGAVYYEIKYYVGINWIGCDQCITHRYV